jgi:site-specific DNA recombinase
MMPKAIGYGRKSFDDPENRTSSIDDQEMFARNYAVQHGFAFDEFYGDNGITGATMERPGLQAALAALKAGKAQILIIEDVDRLGRDQEHLSFMRKLFTAYEVTVHTVAAGKLDDLTFSFKGIIGEQQRMRIAYTTRRGRKGKATRGGSTGGKILGYVKEVLGFDAQGRQIDRLATSSKEAALVLRIFQLYADGYSLKAICKILNREGVPSPRARERGKYNAGIWNASTLSGNVDLGEGILNNQIYIGQRIANRRRWVEIPNENRGFSRRPRLNPESEWMIRDEPDLRIIEQELWDRVKARQVEARAARDGKYKITNNPLAGAKRPQHLLSGLVRCGVCHGDFVSTGDRWRCKAAMRQDCSNGSITGAQPETRSLEGLRSRLLTPEVIGRFARHLQRELDVQQQTANGKREEMESTLREARSKIAKIVKRIEDDEDAPRALHTRLKELEIEEARLEQSLSGLPDRVVVRLPANYEAVYRTAITRLEQHLATADAASSRNAIRALIEAVVVHAGNSRGGKVRRLELHGDLFRMMDFADAGAGGNVKRCSERQASAAKAVSVDVGCGGRI